MNALALIDRQSHTRSNLKQLWSDRDVKSKTMVFNGNKFMTANGGLLWIDQHQLRGLLPSSTSMDTLEDTLKDTSMEDTLKDAPTLVFLGKDRDETAYWAMDVASSKDLIEKFNRDKIEFVDPRPACFALDEFEAAVFAEASAVLDFNRRIKFCAGCGSKTSQADAGWKRVCSNAECVSHNRTENYSYVRTDAVAIVNVVSPCGTKILLGRQKSWPKKRYSCIAGFLEPGESVVQAARREVLEETGIVVDECVFHSSQPWPFPSQIMLGFQARAVSTAIDIISRDQELEDAKWFSRTEVLEALEGKDDAELALPPSYAIAHTLIKWWAGSGSK